MNRTTLLWTLLLTLSSACLFAQEGDLVVFTTDGTKFNLALDNKFQNPVAATRVKVTDIPEGNYWVTLYFGQVRKAVKSNLRIMGNKENSFVLEEDGGSWKLKSYSSVARNQVNAAATGQNSIAYNRTGVTVNGMASSNDIKSSEMEQKNEVVRVQGTRNDLAAEAERNRMGQYRGTYKTETKTASNAPQPEEGTTITKRYIETKNPDGTVSITEEVTTTIRTVVQRDGQPQMRTKRSKALTPTDYTCLPMETADFEAMLSQAQPLAEPERLQWLQKELPQKCLTPDQIKRLGNLFQDIDTRQAYAQMALPTNADPNNFPYQLQDVANNMPKDPDAEPFPDEESTEAQEARDAAAHSATSSEEKMKAEKARAEAAAKTAAEAAAKAEAEAKPKSKAELKAEQRLAKIKAREAKKAAKAKEKAERKAAKEKAKAEKAAAKAAAKAKAKEK